MTPDEPTRRGQAPAGSARTDRPVKRVSSRPADRGAAPEGNGRRGAPRREGERRPGDGSARPAAARQGQRPPGSRPPGSRPPGSRPPGSRPPGSRPAGARPSPRDLPDYVEPPFGQSSWTAFFRPVKSARRGTMPAGMVLVVVVMALVASMFLSADSLNRKAAGRRNNTDLRRNLAEYVFNASEGLKLDAPAKSFDDFIAPYVGHERKTEQIGSDDVLAARRAREAQIRGATSSSTAAPATTAGGDNGGNVDPTAPTTPPTTADPRPKIRKPTPDNPLKVWVGGDSISYEPGIAVQNIAAQTKLFNVITDARPSTGLTRPDFFNWPQHLDRDVVPLDGGGIDPDIVMIMFGGNDAQNIPAYAPEGNEVAVLGTPEWQAQYRKRVGDAMDLLRSPKDDRLVMWLGSPIMGPNTVKHLDQLDYIFYTEAIKRPWVVYFDSWAFFTDAAGNYAKALPAADGQVHVMRANDNIHFSALGGDRLASAAYAKLATLVDLSAVPFVPDPDKAPPPEIKERPEVPPGEGSVPAP